MLKKQATLRFFTANIRALIMASLARNDPFLKGFHSLPLQSPTRPQSSLLFRNGNVSFDNSGSPDFRINRGGGALMLKGCCSDSSRDQKARAFAPNNQLVRDFEARLEDRSTSINGRFVDDHGLCGKLPGFQDFPLTEKIVVAVDVDEGIGLFPFVMLSLFLLFYMDVLNSWSFVWLIIGCLNICSIELQNDT